MMRWLLRLFRRRALERDLDRELRFHIEQHVRDLMSYGVTQREAERRARWELGGVEQVKEAARDARGTRWLEDWWQDTRFAARAMAREPVFTIAAVLTLALGIGANTAVWSLADGVMFRTLPIEQPEQLHVIRKSGVEDDSYLMSVRRFREFQAVAPERAQIAAMTISTRAYATIATEPEPLTMQLVSGEWFGLLGIDAALGRVMVPSDDRTPGGHPVVVLSEGYWARRFGSDPAVLGRVIRLNGTPVSVIGVARSGFQGLTVGQSVDAWVPIMMQHEVRYKTDAYSDNADSEQPWPRQDGMHWLTLLVRVNPSHLAEVQPLIERRYRAEVERDAAGLSPERAARTLRERAVVESLSQGFSTLRAYFDEPLRFLMVAVALVLLITCANLAGLLLARSTSRGQEFAVRLALGAKSGRLIRQLLSESVLLALCGGLVGLAVAHWAAQGLVRSASSGRQPIPLDVGLDARLLAFAFLLSLFTGLLFGLAPALSATRASLFTAFKSGGRVFGTSTRLPLGRVLVGCQIGLSLVLVISAGLFVRTFQNVMAIDPGYEANRIVTARVDVRASGLGPEQLAPYYAQLLDAVRAVPGVRSASLSLYGPAANVRSIASYKVPGRAFNPDVDRGQEDFVTPDFFSTTGMTLLHGRGFNAADDQGSVNVVVVTETFAKHFFGRSDVLGRRFGYDDGEANFEIIGVVRDARINQIREQPQPVIFRPLTQGRQRYISSIEARVNVPSSSVIESLRRAIASVNRSVPIRDVAVVREILERGLWRERVLARLAGGFGVVALMLSAIGLYGVMAYLVARRTNEIGVRLALGARPSQVRWLVLRDSLVTIGAGVTFGIVLAIPLVNLARNFLYGLSPRDPSTTAIAAALTIGVGISAALLPAWRASRVDPQRAIRAE
jgi:predicted permease